MVKSYDLTTGQNTLNLKQLKQYNLSLSKMILFISPETSILNH